MDTETWSSVDIILDRRWTLDVCGRRNRRRKRRSKRSSKEQVERRRKKEEEDDGRRYRPYSAMKAVSEIQNGGSKNGNSYNSVSISANFLRFYFGFREINE